MKWVFQPDPAPSSQGVACCDVVNRGAAYWNGKIIYNTLDVQTVAVDANSGKQVWKTRLGDINMGESITMAPIVAKGVVLVGNSGGEFGVRGWLAGLDADTGKLKWRAYGTGPDKDTLMGANFKPFYSKDRGPDLGVKSWPGDTWKIGGAAAWSWISPGARVARPRSTYGPSSGAAIASDRPGASESPWPARAIATSPSRPTRMAPS